MKKLKLALVIGSLLGCSFGLQASEFNIENYNQMTLEEKESNYSKLMVQFNEGYNLQDFKNLIGKEVHFMRSASFDTQILLIEGSINIEEIRNSEILKSIDISKKIIRSNSNFNNLDIPNFTTSSNDPLAAEQIYLEDTASFKGASSISRAKEEKQQKNKQVKIGIVDTGVLNHEDVVFHDGENFVSNEGRDRSDGFVDKSNNNDLSCVSGHGLSVASVFGAIDNNSLGLSNIVDAQIVMARGFEKNCSTGNDEAEPEDIADSIYWLAGGVVNDIPPLSEKVDVINLSLGYTENCPALIQQSIDFAVNNGVIVVVSAGNEGHDVSNHSPSNCNNVINVAANDSEANKISMSNFGNLVDVSALGKNIKVASSAGDNMYGTTSGTSLSAPIISGISGLVKEKYEIVNQEDLRYLLKETATEQGTGFSGSSGIANAYNAMSLADQLFGFETNISHYFQNFENCEQTTYLNQMINLGVNVCEMHNVTITEIEDYTDVKYQLIKREKAADSWTDSNTILVDEFFNLTEEKTFSYKLKEFEDAYEYGVRICDMNDNCFNSQDLDVSTIFKPEFCE